MSNNSKTEKKLKKIEIFKKKNRKIMHLRRWHCCLHMTFHGLMVVSPPPSPPRGYADDSCCVDDQIGCADGGHRHSLCRQPKWHMRLVPVVKSLYIFFLDLRRMRWGRRQYHGQEDWTPWRAHGRGFGVSGQVAPEELNEIRGQGPAEHHHPHDGLQQYVP
jgi:hypothetical protein